MGEKAKNQVEWANGQMRMLGLRRPRTCKRCEGSRRANAGHQCHGLKRVGVACVIYFGSVEPEAHVDAFDQRGAAEAEPSHRQRERDMTIVGFNHFLVCYLRGCAVKVSVPMLRFEIR